MLNSPSRCRTGCFGIDAAPRGTRLITCFWIQDRLFPTSLRKCNTPLSRLKFFIYGLFRNSVDQQQRRDTCAIAADTPYGRVKRQSRNNSVLSTIPYQPVLVEESSHHKSGTGLLHGPTTRRAGLSSNNTTQLHNNNVNPA